MTPQEVLKNLATLSNPKTSEEAKEAVRKILEDDAATYRNIADMIEKVLAGVYR